MIGVDLFSGAGGMSLGARMSGIDVQHVIELDRYSAMTYLHNHKPKYGIFNDDIRKYKGLDIERNNQELIVFGGPPCQGFSTSNQRTRTTKNTNNWLYKEFFRVVKHFSPDWVVFENVRGLFETAGGIFVEKILSEFDKLGYTTSLKLLNATDFGVPQKRTRLFIVGALNGQVFQFPEPLIDKPVSVKQAINDLPKLQNGASVSYQSYSKAARSEYAKLMRMGAVGSHNHLVTRNGKQIIKRYGHIPQGGNWESIPNQLMRNYSDKSRCHTGIYRRLEENKPSVVIGNYRKNMLIHPWHDRGLSVREAARLQSFPDNFEFMGSIGFQQQQVGNAVPPLLAKAIFQQIKGLN